MLSNNSIPHNKELDKFIANIPQRRMEKIEQLVQEIIKELQTILVQPKEGSYLLYTLNREEYTYIEDVLEHINNYIDSCYMRLQSICYTFNVKRVYVGLSVHYYVCLNIYRYDTWRQYFINYFTEQLEIEIKSDKYFDTLYFAVDYKYNATAAKNTINTLLKPLGYTAYIKIVNNKYEVRITNKHNVDINSKL